MNKVLFLLLTSISLLFSSCSEEEDGSSCAKPEFSITPGTGNNNVSSGSAYVSARGCCGSAFSFYEIEYGAQGFTKGSGTTSTIAGTTYLNNLSNGIYDLYIRGYCDDGAQWGEWAGPKSFLVQNAAPSCATPTNLGAGSLLWLTWEHSPSGEADKYELEYGTTGFSRGSGTLVTVLGSYGSYSGGVFAKGTTYDFYVRASCDGTNWSDWTSAYTFTASVNRNRCLCPTQINAYTAVNFWGDCVGYEFQWDENGESNWEVALVGRNDSPESGNIESMQSTGITYFVACGYSRDFYIRAVCSNGNKTSWCGPRKSIRFNPLLHNQ